MENINELEKRKEQSRKCDNCLDWHKYCNVECCKIVFIKLNPKLLDEVKGKFLVMRKHLGYDMRWYFKMRGIKYDHGFVKVPVEHCVAAQDQILYVRKCDLLNGCLCAGHPHKKPEFCKQLVLETVEHNRGNLTENCLFKYKLEDEENGKE